MTRAKKHSLDQARRQPLRVLVDHFASRYWFITNDAKDLAFRFGRPVSAKLLAMAGSALRSIGLGSYSGDLTFAASRLTDGQLFLDNVAEELQRLSTVASYFQPNAPALPKRCICIAPPVWDGRNCLVRRGVLVATFTSTFDQLWDYLHANNLCSQYHIVLEPSWSGYADRSILRWASYGEPVLVQSPERRDRDFLTKISKTLIPIELGPGDWIDPADFRPLDAAKRFDVVTVANLAWYKRVHAFLRGVREAKNQRSDFRAAIVLSSWAGQRQSLLMAAIRSEGLGDSVTVFCDLNRAQLNDVYNRSKLCVLTSLKEGGNRAIFEAMWSNVPVVVLAANVGVNKDYINASTGRLSSERELGKCMLEMTADIAKWAPRAWAERHLSPVATRRRLASHLRSLFPSEHWDETFLAIKVNSPEARLLQEFPQTDHTT